MTGARLTLLLVSTLCLLAQGRRAQDDGYGQGQDEGDTGYEQEPTYQAPHGEDQYGGDDTNVKKVVEIITRPGKCTCNRDAPCFDKKANKCVKAICDGRPEPTFTKGMASPEIKIIEDANDPNAIVIGVSLPGMDVLDDDPEGLSESGNDEGANYPELEYGDAQYEEKLCFPCRCPRHTHRCQDFNKLGKWGSIFLGLEFLLMFLVAGLCLYEAFSRVASLRMWYAVAGVCATISALTCFAIMTQGGMLIRCWDTRHYYWIRYFGYMLIAPQFLWIVCAVARGGGLVTRQRPFSVFIVSSSQFVVNANLILLSAASFVMFLAWMVGAFIEEADKWVYFMFGLLCLVAIIAVLERTGPGLVPNLLFYRVFSRLLWVTWLLIALLWVFDEGLGWVSIDTQMILFFLLDLVWIGIYALVTTFVPWQKAT